MMRVGTVKDREWCVRRRVRKVVVAEEVEAGEAGVCDRTASTRGNF